jgi:hypothetical protein
MYETSAYGLLCLSAVRRLFALRNGQHGPDARKACRAWIKDLKIIHQLQKENAK